MVIPNLNMVPCYITTYIVYTRDEIDFVKDFFIKSAEDTESCRNCYMWDRYLQFQLSTVYHSPILSLVGLCPTSFYVVYGSRRSAVSGTQSRSWNGYPTDTVQGVLLYMGKKNGLICLFKAECSALQNLALNPYVLNYVRVAISSPPQIITPSLQIHGRLLQHSPLCTVR